MEGRGFCSTQLIEFCDVAKGCIYIPAFRNAIHTGSAQYYDIQIGQTFIEEWKQFKTGPTKEDHIAAAMVTEEIRSIFGFRSLEINPASGNETLQLMIDGQSYNLPEVGAGLSQFVMLLAYVAVRKPKMVAIDEPELNLHPLLQQDLLAGLRGFCAGPILFGTHSLGLARAVSAATYVVTRSDRHSDMRPLANHPRLSELLGELSFDGYRELGFDKVLLVEGPHDVTTIREMLRILGKERDFVLLPLGGSSVINGQATEQLEEIKRITDNVFAVVDSERIARGSSPSSNVVGFEAACTSAKVDCHVLQRRAIENYLSDSAVKQVKGAKYSALSDFERLDDAAMPWSKGENASIARAMTKADFETTDLGQFLARI